MRCCTLSQFHRTLCTDGNSIGIGGDDTACTLQDPSRTLGYNEEGCFAPISGVNKAGGQADEAYATKTKDGIKGQPGDPLVHTGQRVVHGDG